MKKSMIAFLSCWALFSSFAMATSTEYPRLECQSLSKVEGWTGSATNQFVNFNAFIEEKIYLTRATITGAYMTDQRNLSPDADTAGRFERVRYQTLEDAWCWFNVLLPKDFAAETKEFKGSIQYQCEEWSGFAYIDMKCKVVPYEG